MAESSRLSCLHLNSIVSMTLHLVFSEASRARSVDTIDGQLFIDLIFKVEGEDGLCASIYQTFHWSTNPVPNMEQGSRTSSHCTDLVKISLESTKIQVQTR